MLNYARKKGEYMYLFLNNNLSTEERKSKIDDFVTMIGIQLHNACQANEYLSQEIKQKINVNLCIAYVKNRTRYYFKKVNCGMIKMEVDHLMIEGVVRLAKELSKEKDETVSI